MTDKEASSEVSPMALARRNREAENAMPAVEDFFRTVAHKVRARLVNRAAMEIAVRVAGVEVKSLGSVIEDSEYREGAIYSLLRFTPLGLPGMIVLQGTLLGRIVGTMLGEDPNEENSVGGVKPLTPVEQQIAHRVCQDLAAELQDGWPVSPTPRIEVDRPASSPRSVTGDVRNVSVFSATFDFGPPTNPYGLLCCSVPVLGFRSLGGPVVIERNQERAPLDMAHLMPLKVDLVAEMARIEMDVRTLKGLAVGDMVDIGPAKTVCIKVNDRPMFEGKAGEVGGHRSVMIARRL